jgi:xylulose-5-phosphate/fructose-6-phosphate phosphoketolase
LPWEGDRQLSQFGARAAYFKLAIDERRIEHRHYIARYGDDMPGISG